MAVTLLLGLYDNDNFSNHVLINDMHSFSFKNSKINIFGLFVHDSKLASQ